MFKTDKARNAEQESIFMMSLCQDVSSSNVSMLTTRCERETPSLHGMSITFKTLYLFNCRSSEHTNEGNLGYVCVRELNVAWLIYSLG